ncbi:MAG TPA: VIT and VWA domain-containing protein, partial [Pirellulales bacterium]
MTSLFIRGMIAVGGLAAAIALCLNLVGPPRLTGAAPFSEVLDELRAQKTLELKVTKEGKAAEVWIRAPGLVRWQDSPQRYKIAAGSRLWKIDESANTVTTGDSPWFVTAKQQIDLVGLLDVGVTESAPLLKAHAIDRSEFDGRDCFVYRVDLPAKQGRVEVTAYADASSKQLVGLVAQPAGAAAKAGPPLAELHLVAVNAPVDESKFVVAKSLTDDGQIGKLTDSQGVVVLRPALAERWTPVGREMPLRVGDWLRTDIRGANAVRVRLSSEVELTLGPGTLVECISPVLARLHTGEAQVKLPKQEHPQFELLGPREGSRKFATTDKWIVRVDRAAEKLADVKEPPKWLQGFEGTSADESLGSLIVNIDGRNEPLAVGYHKVSVEIRDQIARTTIEESFVNSSGARLEGVFHFPLPQDASISDFGMWIGNNLVEADVVEKQRAREIYETILRERRDPGLLEWTGGNIFKARVFPIEAYSEKRIKIVYTQVLPLRASKYRYTYALRSELLRKKPLRELSLTVTVNSALPLKSVRCPTHDARVNETAHSAQVAFAAQEYSPTRDFEVVCEIDGRQSDVVVIPHRRGDDGYLMVQLTPPAAEANWQRELVADGKPLDLVLLCDTSASMDSEKRKQQAEFVATVLSSLSEKDHFWLAAADVSTVWASKEPLAATPENIAKARDFLEHRLSLGWTNLEQAFEAVGKKAPAGAQVIYIGDGIVTAGRADPVDFVNRLGRMFTGGRGEKGSGVFFDPAKADGKNEDDRRVKKDSRSLVFHAVTVGNSFESTVLKAIAGVGGGSVRSIGGEQTPQSVALELLKEIASPGLRDLNVEFRGLKVAAVYPDRLPNLAAGSQQILVGRYLPTGSDQQGEIVVTGRRGWETVRYAAKIDLKDAEAGNSFTPRLWARAHLDHLLA